VLDGDRAELLGRGFVADEGGKGIAKRAGGAIGVEWSVHYFPPFDEVS
jgi:hypothetical protein